MSIPFLPPEGHPVTLIVDVLFMWVLIYYILRVFQGTRAMQAVYGLILFSLFYLGARALNLYAVTTVLGRFWQVMILAIIVLFQPELRRTLSRFGQQRFLRAFSHGNVGGLRDILKAATTMARRRIGAIICIEREGTLESIVSTGVVIDSSVSSELLVTLFTPYTPLHDGAVVIQGGRIAAAACILPLSRTERIESDLGTRHRAALGLTEEYDSIVIVVSEETGIISVCMDGMMHRGMDEESLERFVRNAFEG